MPVELTRLARCERCGRVTYPLIEKRSRCGKWRGKILCGKCCAYLIDINLQIEKEGNDRKRKIKKYENTFIIKLESADVTDFNLKENMEVGIGDIFIKQNKIK